MNDLECLVRFKNIDGDVIFREKRKVPELHQEIDNKIVCKIEYFYYSGYITVDVELVPKRLLSQRTKGVKGN